MPRPGILDQHARNGTPYALLGAQPFALCCVPTMRLDCLHRCPSWLCTLDLLHVDINIRGIDSELHSSSSFKLVIAAQEK